MESLSNELEEERYNVKSYKPYPDLPTEVSRQDFDSVYNIDIFGHALNQNQVDHLYTSLEFGNSQKAEIDHSLFEFQDREMEKEEPLPAGRELLGGDEELPDIFLSDRISIVKEAIAQIVCQIAARRKLNEEFIREIDLKKGDFEFMLKELSRWSLGAIPCIETRRIHLEKELLQLEREGRINKLNCWRDVLLLSKELREAVNEYRFLSGIEKMLL
jgi:hypothetical protein